NGLPDPPGRVSRELASSPPVEFINGPHEPYVSLLNEIEESNTAVGIFFRYRNDEPQVGFDELLAGLCLLGLAGCNQGESPVKLGSSGRGTALEIHQPAGGMTKPGSDGAPRVFGSARPGCFYQFISLAVNRARVARRGS